MPFYRITYTLATGKKHTGIKDFHIRSIDDAFTHFLDKAKATGEVTEFNCVMISTKSDEYKAWLAAKEKRRWNNSPSGDGRIQGPGKYRQKGQGPELGKRGGLPGNHEF